MAEAHIRSEGAIAEVLDLFSEFREARGFGGRARIAVQATRAMAALTPAQRRQLAVDVAQRSAPHLVEKIESDSDLDLTPAQVRAVVEMVGNMDRDDVDALRSSVKDPDWQRRAAERVLGTADDALGDAGVDLGEATLGAAMAGAAAGAPAIDMEMDASDDAEPDEDDDPADEDLEAIDDDGWYQDEEGNWYRDEDGETNAAEQLDVSAADDATELPTAAEDIPPPPPTAGDESARTIARVDPPDGPRSPPQPQVKPAPVNEYRAGLPEMTEWRASGLESTAFAFARRSRPTANRPPTATSPRGNIEEESWFGGGLLGVGAVAVPRTDLGERLRNVERSSEQLRVFHAAAGEFGDMTPGEQASVLRQLRASWVRRRAVLALIEDGRIAASSARAIIGSFDSPVNRAWIVASLVEAGVGTVADWAELLTPAAATRLERRYAA